MKKVSSLIVPAWLLGVVVVDQLTKIMVLANFNLYESKVVIPGFFDLTYITNTGAAFGILAGEQTMLRQAFFVGVAFAALLVMFFSYRHFKDQGSLFIHSIGMIAGGAIGNLIDRLRYVKGYHWPAFNVADSAITIGVAFFILGSLLAPPEQEVNYK